MLPSSLPISINDRQYMIEMSEYQRETIPRLRDPLDTAPEPGEASLQTEGLWRRSQSLFTGGAGQKFFDEDDSSREMFYFSRGLDIWEDGQVTLLPSTQQIFSTSSYPLLHSSGDYLFIVEPDDIHYTSSSSPSSSSDFSSISDLPSNIASVTDDGNYLYIASSSDGIYEADLDSPSSASNLSSFEADFITYARGRLIATKDNEVREIFADGSTEEIYNHRNSDFTWHTATSSPIGVYIGGAAGSSSEGYLISVNQEDGSLNLPIPALELPRSEILYTMEHYGGVVLLGTSVGIRLAQISGGGALVYGPAIEIDGGVHDFSGLGEYAWFTWSSFPDSDDVIPDLSPDSSGLGRLDLSLFSEPLVPTYTSDLMTSDSTSTSTSVTNYKSKRYFAVDGHGVYGPSSDLVEEGTLITGWIRYGTVEPKVASRLDVVRRNSYGSLSAQLLIDPDELISLELDPSESDDYKRMFRGPDGEDIQIGERAMACIKLHRDSSDPTLSPKLTRWTLRSIATPQRMEQIQLPIILSPTVTTPTNQSVSYDTLEEFKFLNSFVGTGLPVTYREGDTSWRAYLDGISLQARDWDPQYSYFTGLIILRLLLRESLDEDPGEENDN